MEDVLDLYAEPYSAQFPVVCFDERPYQLVSETRQPLPLQPGLSRRYDYEYRREGTCNLFTSFQPLQGWRRVAVTAQRTRLDFARQMQHLADVDFPQAERIRVVLDNLNIHCPSTLYEVFSPADARRLVRRLEFHYTPKHGSWLNMAEAELAVLSRQCLNRRIAKNDTLCREIAAWEVERNARHATVNWQFETADARTKLARLYPS